MSEDTKRSVPGALTATLKSDDRKPLPPSATAAPAGKRVVIKSADMFGDMQKEAIDIAIAVSSFLFLSFFLGFCLFCLIL